MLQKQCTPEVPVVQVTTATQNTAQDVVTKSTLHTNDTGKAEHAVVAKRGAIVAGIQVSQSLTFIQSTYFGKSHRDVESNSSNASWIRV